jgi:hypothetical protein
MKTKRKKLAYQKLRDIIQDRGGSMRFQRQGHTHGAWEIRLNGKSATIKAMGCQTFPELDRLYIPEVPEPKTWDHYSDKLVPDAEQRLLALLI